ncbi:VOC family protein [Rhizobium laguerreae]|uniref:VOC family protein n=1 Tax=Rhizobium laguerreae TaxID=1076926 RepID=A0AB35FA98_9HYPH|nr:VOC family protein [Rhizobium laguerreae]MBY3063270.1 VOC family protein [Rhizobium laguerreae]MBY3075932.1 VOC family protein [Rhizobium laguerreae]MBY3112172.1 VOC family protein [Rhizobium laguerreae]MBY3201114.1 VOC family protein [Rhizobium laguerreae]MBY3244440.1 VOC family protein [Rhizobium laguerreae]
MNEHSAKPHPLDHVVLPVVNIDLARERLGKLGFTVAADARHPFGTENACVFFADKTYLEPLGIASVKESEASARQGNVFTARNQAFRFRCGEEGLLGLAFGSKDAGIDHQNFVGNGSSAGEMLQFTRPMTMPDGSETIAGFKLAFAGDLRAPDLLLFTVERVNPLPADRAALETHANGVTGIVEIALCTPEPAAFAAFVSLAVAQSAVEKTGFGVDIAASNAKISLTTPEGLDAYFDIAGSCADRGLRGRAILFAVVDLAVTEAHLAANGVTYTRKNNRILVKPAPGQGTLFAFEETR